MNISTNSNDILKQLINQKWPLDYQKEWWYSKLGAVRRQKLLRCSEQQNHRCCYCGIKTWHPSYNEAGNKNELATLEHVQARSKGGSESMMNLTMACAGCNNDRNDHWEALRFYEMTINREARKRVPTPEDIEAMRQKEINKVLRTNRLMIEAAWTLHVLGLKWFLDAWLEHAEQTKVE